MRGRVKLRDLKINSRFRHIDKFDHGWIRETIGRKIGQTIIHWDVISVESQRHYHPETGEEKFHDRKPKDLLWDSRVQVEEK